MAYVAKRFAEKRLPLTFHIDDETIQLEYRPFVFTPELDEEVRGWAKAQPEQFRGEIASLFVRLVASWDVVYEEGDSEPIALTVENLVSKPDLLVLELALIDAIRKEVNLGEALSTSLTLNGHSPTLSGAKKRH